MILYGSRLATGENEHVKIGTLQVWPPVVLAPMAGITNIGFRALCREQGGGLFVSEMITSRALVERVPLTFEMIRFGEAETPRSIQLYGVDPVIIGKAAKMIAEEDLADHIDLNFGCPVPKVTRRGGGSALPYKRNLLRAILKEAVANAGTLPVTLDIRKSRLNRYRSLQVRGLRSTRTYAPARRPVCRRPPSGERAGCRGSRPRPSPVDLWQSGTALMPWGRSARLALGDGARDGGQPQPHDPLDE